MPREARRRSASGIYHIMLRGADGRNIFGDDRDRERFCTCLMKAKEASGFKLYAYCLMGNHVHLLVREGEEPIGTAMKRVGVAYVQYYNRRYQLHGHLFQDRFRSETVETDAYLLDVLRYICRNPVKAGLSRDPFSYRWLGMNGTGEDGGITDGLEALSEMNDAELKNFVREPSRSEHLEDLGPKQKTDREALEILKERCGCGDAKEIEGWDEEARGKAVRTALRSGISIRQLSRLTGISKATVERLGKG